MDQIITTLQNRSVFKRRPTTFLVVSLILMLIGPAITYLMLYFGFAPLPEKNANILLAASIGVAIEIIGLVLLLITLFILARRSDNQAFLLEAVLRNQINLDLATAETIQFEATEEAITVTN